MQLGTTVSCITGARIINDAVFEIFQNKGRPTSAGQPLFYLV